MSVAVQSLDASRVVGTSGDSDLAYAASCTRSTKRGRSICSSFAGSRHVKARVSDGPGAIIRSIGVITLALAVAWPLAAQQPAAQPPVFRSGTSTVGVDVVVHDKTGRFVDRPEAQGLRSQRQRPARANRFLLSSRQRRARRRRSGRAEAGRANGGAPSPPVHTPRVFIVVFDDGHLTPAGFKRAQTAALELFAQGVPARRCRRPARWWDDGEQPADERPG